MTSIPPPTPELKSDDERSHAYITFEGETRVRDERGGWRRARAHELIRRPMWRSVVFRDAED